MASRASSQPNLNRGRFGAPFTSRENMPFAIDQEKLDSPDMKMLDIAKPPLKYIQHEDYP